MPHKTVIAMVVMLMVSSVCANVNARPHRPKMALQQIMAGDTTRSQAMAVAPPTKPTKAQIKKWLDPRGVCPAPWFAQLVESQGYPHRKDCDKPRPVSLFERCQGIDTGNLNDCLALRANNRKK